MNRVLCQVGSGSTMSRIFGTSRVALFSSDAGNEVVRGVVRWFNPTKGYGFIQPEASDEDIFVHYTSITRQGSNEYRVLEDGESVTFEIVPGKGGKSQATNVVRETKA